LDGEAAASQSANDNGLGEIDPDLLETPAGKSAIEWAIIAGAALVIIASAVLLFAMLA
jgi:hypothetical protein